MIVLTGGKETVNTEVYPISGACLPMQRCQLQITELSEDEESCAAHKDLQEEGKWGLSYLQTTYCSLLLSCQILSGTVTLYLEEK